MSTRTPLPEASRTTRWGLLGVILAAVLLRGAVMVAHRDHLDQDPDAYRLIAENLRERGAFTRAVGEQPATATAFRPPLYPLLLAATAWQTRVTGWQVAILHLAIGALTVVLVWNLARDCGLRRGSWLAAALVACDPILLNQSAEVMTEPLATLLVVICLLLLTRATARTSPRLALVAGVALGCAQLCRPTFLLWMLACVGFLTLLLPSPWRWRMAGLVCLGFAVTVAPWVLRNYWALGRPILTTTHGGYTLLLANNPAFYAHLRDNSWQTVWDARELTDQLPAPPRSDLHPEIAADRQLYDRARQAIRNDPAMFAYSTVYRLVSFWSPLPHQLSADESRLRQWSRYAVAIWYGAVFLMAAGGCWSLGRRLLYSPWIWGLLVLCTLTAAHAVYWSNMRMRAPAMPVVYLLAAAATCTARTRRRATTVEMGSRPGIVGQESDAEDRRR